MQIRKTRKRRKNPTKETRKKSRIKVRKKTKRKTRKRIRKKKMARIRIRAKIRRKRRRRMVMIPSLLPKRAVTVRLPLMRRAMALNLLPAPHGVAKVTSVEKVAIKVARAVPEKKKRKRNRLRPQTLGRVEMEVRTVKSVKAVRQRQLLSSARIAICSSVKLVMSKVMSLPLSRLTNVFLLISRPCIAESAIFTRVL
jgi:hypothetical protein